MSPILPLTVPAVPPQIEGINVPLGARSGSLGWGETIGVTIGVLAQMHF